MRAPPLCSKRYEVEAVSPANPGGGAGRFREHKSPACLVWLQRYANAVKYLRCDPERIVPNFKAGLLDFVRRLSVLLHKVTRARALLHLDDVMPLIFQIRSNCYCKTVVLKELFG